MRLVILTISLCFATEKNPIGQVLNLIQKLHNTVVEDGEKEQEEYESFAKLCEDQAKEHQSEIKTASAQTADLAATIEKATADLEVANARVAELSQGISTNEVDLKATTEIRAKEHETFKKQEQELVETVHSLNRAQTVLSTHLNKDEFAQLPLEKLAVSLGAIVDSGLFATQDKERLHAFLQAHVDGIQASEGKAYEAHSGGILETLSDMQEKAEAILAEARKAEVSARHNAELLVHSLRDEIKVQNEALSATKQQLQATGEAKATAEGDLSRTNKDLTEDKVDLKDLASNCQRRAVDWESSQKCRAEELKALTDAKRIIEEATGGASSRQYSFLQISRGFHFDEVALAIKKLGKRTKDVMLAQLSGQIRATVSINADPFGKVKELIQNMLEKLVKEASEEASQKAFCDKETGENEAKRTKLQKQVGKLSTSIERNTADTVKFKLQVSDLQASVASIRKSQKEMNILRKEEHTEWIKAKSDFQQGLEGIRTALRVLRDYYQSKGETFMQAGKSADAAGGIISILEVAESDFSRSLAVGQETEDDAADVYEKTTQENKVAIASKEANSESKTQESARLQKIIGDFAGDRDSVSEELSAVLEYLEKLRPQCTTVPDSYEERKKRREQEIDGLKDALDILESETAFMQTFLSVKRRRLV